jgi:hypothetical protein
VDKQVFIQNLEQVKRRKILLIRIGLSLLFVTLIASMWLSKTKTSPSVMLTFKMVAIAFFAGLAYSFISMIQKMSRRLNLYCPNCNRSLSGPVSHKVLSSDQCFQCGMKLF